MVAGEQRAVALVHPGVERLVVPERVVRVEADEMGHGRRLEDGPGRRNPLRRRRRRTDGAGPMSFRTHPGQRREKDGAECRSAAACLQPWYSPGDNRREATIVTIMQVERESVWAKDVDREQ